MKIKLLITFIVLCGIANAQTTFQKEYGLTGDEFANSVQQTSDGGFIVAGYTMSFGGIDAYLVRTDANGDTLWVKMVSQSGASNDAAASVQETSDGGFVFAGLSALNANYDEVYLVKVDANGAGVWSKTYGGPNQNDQGHSVQQTTDGGYIVAGWTHYYGVSGFNMYLIKTDANGDTLWTKTYGGAGEYGLSVQQTSDNGYVIAGITGFGAGGGGDIYLVKTDTNGDTLWTKAYGGSTGSETGNSVQQTTDGGYVIAGTTNSFGAGANDIYVVKTDVNGDTLWSRTFGGTGDDEGYSVQETADGGFIFSGFTNSYGAGGYDMYVIKTDANGGSVWTDTYGGTGDDYARSVQEMAGGGFIIAGSSNSFGAGGKEMYLVKTDALGNSGCNEGSLPGSIVNAPATIISNTATQISYGANVVSPTPFTLSGGTITVMCASAPTAISAISKENSVSIFPNPFNSSAVIQFNSSIENADLDIYNRYGQKIRTINSVSGDKIKIDRENLPNEIYFIRLTKDNKTIATGKLIIAD